jgi:ABC-type polysaccharide/polyol phosphate transport system ATPase subunit
VSAIAVTGLEKRFRIPSAHRLTVREHLFGLLKPRQWENLDVLRGVSFTIQQGETVGIMGRNGSGKSTLLKIIAGIYQPDAGRVEVNGAVTPILQLGLGWNPELTARDNLELTGTAMGLTLREVRSRFDEIIAFAELERFVDLQVKFYSSGMSARLAYSIAFTAVREVLLLDEIFAVGDGAFSKRCQERFAELKKAGHTMILVTHSPTLIEDNCERALLIEGGRLISDADSRTTAQRYRELLGVEDEAAVRS